MNPENTSTTTSPPTQRCMSVPRQRLGATGKLHHVLQPKLTQPPRSTKPLTLPEELQLRTSSRLRTGARQPPQQQQEQVGGAAVQPAAAHTCACRGGVMLKAAIHTMGNSTMCKPSSLGTSSVGSVVWALAP
jgi:hypothetical protein